MQLIQRWDNGQNAFMLGQCEEQKKTGRIIPQINEEYGYEDLWEKTPGQRRADTRRRCAWEIVMAGCYQTAGESARTGTGVAPDTGGGWVNGRGDDSMTMLGDYRRLADFFTAFDWWTCRPRKVGSGGNRIVHMADTMGSRAGLDLVVEKKGELVLGVNAYPDTSPARSRPDAISADPDAGQDNWRFFAVTYDATAAMDNVKFYLGDVGCAAELDRGVTYAQGPLGARTGPLTVGAFNPTSRGDKGDRVFRGLIDDIRVFGSTTDGAGALELEPIRNIQRGSNITR